MIKKFLKSHSIHKKIVPSLDFFMLLRPTLFFSVWVMICIGMYIASILHNNPQMNIINYRHDKKSDPNFKSSEAKAEKFYRAPEPVPAE